MSREQGAVPPVRKSIRVDLPVGAAFRRFTTEIAAWWPLSSHSVARKNAETVVFEERVGGRIFERVRDGTESTWGTVLVWEPSQRVAFTWHPGREPNDVQRVEVTFTAASAGTTVELVHTGWDFFGAQAKLYRSGYHVGWDHVLGFYLGRNRFLLTASTVPRLLFWWVSHPAAWSETVRGLRRRKGSAA